MRLTFLRWHLGFVAGASFENARDVAGELNRGVDLDAARRHALDVEAERHVEVATETGEFVRGGEAFFQRAEIRQAMRAISSAAARDDLPEDADLVTLVRAVLVPLGLTDAEPTGTQARQRWESLRALVTLAEDLRADVPDIDIAGLATELAARSQARQPPTVQGVTLSSLHAAKGLELSLIHI